MIFFKFFVSFFCQLVPLQFDEDTTVLIDNARALSYFNARNNTRKGLLKSHLVHLQVYFILDYWNDAFVDKLQDAIQQFMPSIVGFFVFCSVSVLTSKLRPINVQFTVLSVHCFFLSTDSTQLFNRTQVAQSNNRDAPAVGYIIMNKRDDTVIKWWCISTLFLFYFILRFVCYACFWITGILKWVFFFFGERKGEDGVTTGVSI